MPLKYTEGPEGGFLPTKHTKDTKAGKGALRFTAIGGPFISRTF
jgi:hypothetical protein